MGRVKKNSGFTVAELIVTMVVSSILVVSVVSAMSYFLTNTAVTDARNKTHGELQSGLQRIASYIRSADNVLLYNLSPDVNAPSSRQGEALNVPGPDADTEADDQDDDYRYYWRSTAKQLVMAQPSRDSSGNPIYTDPANLDFSGPRDSTVLYVKGNAMYMRVIRTSQSASQTQTCAGTSQIGGCETDIKLVSDIKLDGSGSPLLTITYYDGAGVPIPAALSDGTNNYNARKLTKAVKIDMTLERTVGEQKVTVNDSSTISFRTGYVPGSTVIGANNGAGVGTGATAPPWSMAGNMYVGPGGLNMPGFGTITGIGLNVIGRITTNMWANIGTATAPMAITVGNQACGTAPSWPALCSTQPITGASQYSPSIYGRVCATGQTSGTGMANTGLQASCTAPPIVMPTYDRQTFFDSMKTQQPANNGSCSVSNFTAKTLGPDIVYAGSLTNSWLLCQMKIKGNIYVKGDMISTTAITLRVDESVGLKRPIVVVEGDIKLNTLLQSIIPNSYGTGIDFISFKSSNANCLTTPACRDRTDPALLYNSHNQTTIDVGPLSAPGSTFYSYYGGVNVGAIASIGSVSGQTVTINGVSTTVSGF